LEVATLLQPPFFLGADNGGSTISTTKIRLFHLQRVLHLSELNAVVWRRFNGHHLLPLGDWAM